jgi:hypothetical protein
MTNSIARVFYDKQVDILTSATTVDAEGGVVKTGLTVESSFLANVNFSNCRQIQEDYGLDYAIDISITAPVDTLVVIGDIIRYQDVVYNVTDVIKHDSHVLIIATKWRQ